MLSCAGMIAAMGIAVTYTTLASDQVRSYEQGCSLGALLVFFTISLFLIILVLSGVVHLAEVYSAILGQ